MATTSNTYTGNGTNKLFSITFPYLATSDINVYLNGTLQTITTQYTFANATTVEFVTAPANGAVVLLDRSTDDNTLQATFFPGSSIKANDLNFNFDQVLYLSQETANSAANQSTAGLQTQITAATNTANAAVVTANTANSTANAANTTANGIAGTANTALTTANAAEATANGIAATANTALSNSSAAVATANTALPLAGGTMTGVITYAAAQPRLVISTAVNPTSGPSVDFPSIPSWVKRISVNFANISTNGTSAEVIRVGTSSGFVTSGYAATCSYITDGTIADANDSSTGFILIGQNASGNQVQLSGRVVIDLVGVFSGLTYWACSGVISRIDPGINFQKFVAGQVGFSGTLDRIQLTTLVGTAAFDGGLVNIIYEG